MSNPEVVEQQRKLLAQYRANLAHEIGRAAMFGGEPSAPPDIAHGIRYARLEIGRIKRTLRDMGESVDDQPGESEPAAPQQLAQAIGAGPAVLFDEAHGQTRWFGVPAPTVAQGYRRIADVTRERFRVDVLRPNETLDAARLAPYAAFIVPIGPEGLAEFSLSERNAIMDFVGQGRGLLLLSTYTGDWHHEANFNLVARRYGMMFNNNSIGLAGSSSDEFRRSHGERSPRSRFAVTCEPIAPAHPVVAGVRRIVTVSACSLLVFSDGEGLLAAGAGYETREPLPEGAGVRFSEYRDARPGPAVCVAASTTHRVIAVGSWKTFIDEFVDAPGFENMQLFRNMLAWMTGA